MTKYLYEKGIKIFDYPKFAGPFKETIRANAERIAKEHGVEIEFIRKAGLRKESIISEKIEKRGNYPGIVHVMSAMEAYNTYKPRHNPFEEKVGATPTLSIHSGTVCRSGEIKRWQETLGFFRIFYINVDQFKYTPPLRFCKDPTESYNRLQLNLSLDFKNPNDGSSTVNKAVL